MLGGQLEVLVSGQNCSHGVASSARISVAIGSGLNVPRRLSGGRAALCNQMKNSSTLGNSSRSIRPGEHERGLCVAALVTHHQFASCSGTSHLPSAGDRRIVELEIAARQLLAMDKPACYSVPPRPWEQSGERWCRLGNGLRGSEASSGFGSIVGEPGHTPAPARFCCAIHPGSSLSSPCDLADHGAPTMPRASARERESRPQLGRQQDASAAAPGMYGDVADGQVQDGLTHRSTRQQP